MKIYQVWDSHDAAASDQFFTNKKDALAYKRVLDTDQSHLDSSLTDMERHSGEMTVREVKKLNRATLCEMLTNWPQR